MSHWETIQDKFSHISPVKQTIQRDHSTERVDDMFEAVYKASYKSTTTKTTLELIQKKPKRNLKRILQLAVCFLLLSSLAFQWKCTTDPNTNDLCKYKLNIQPDTIISKAQRTKDEYLEKINFNWPIEQYHNAKASYITHVEPSVNWITEHVRSLWIEFQNQLEAYVESGRPKSLGTKEIEVEDKFKATAKKIVDYVNNKSRKTGMKQEEAREKAREILNNMLLKSHKEAIQVPSVPGDKSDKVAYEIQSIMKIAEIERLELDKQFSIIQSNIENGKFSQHENPQDFELFIDAIKVEIEGLRMRAEDKVRARTKSALASTHSDNPIVNQHIKQDLLSAQKTALKELRQIYIKLYQTNKMIDELSIS